MGPRNGARGVTLVGLMPITRGGKTYHYFRRKGQPLVRLPDLPIDHPDFLAAYAEAKRQGAPPRERNAPGSMGALLDAALASKAYLAFKPGYRAILRRHLDAVRVAFGPLPAAGLRDRHIEADVARASDPVARFKAWRFLGGWAKADHRLKEDPTKGMKGPKRARTPGNRPWTHEEIAAYRARWAVGTVARAAMELLFWTGARISDGVLIGPQHVDRDGVLTFRQTKTGEPAHVPWTCPLPAYAARLAPDRELAIAAVAPLQGNLIFLPARGREARSVKALGTLIQKAARDAGILDKSAHGLRKARAVALAEAGATTHQIAAWTGHTSLKEVEHYTEAAARRAAVMGDAPTPPKKHLRPIK